MSMENHARITEVLEALRVGLSDYVLREYEDTFGNEEYIKELKKALIRRQAYSKVFHNKEEAIRKIDPVGWVIVCLYSREEVFKNKLGDNEESYLKLLYQARNIWGHQSPENTISDRDVYYIASTTTRLLEAIGAKEEAETIQNIADDLSSQRSNKDEQNPRQTTKNHKRSPIISTDNGIKRTTLGGVITAPVDEKEEAGDQDTTAPDDNEGEQPVTPSPDSKAQPPEQKSHADDAIQQLIRQHQEMMQRMTDHLKTTESANTVVIQRLFRQNQEMMRHIQQMQASHLKAYAVVIQRLFCQNQEMMQRIQQMQASQSTASANDDAIEQLMRQNQAFMKRTAIRFAIKPKTVVIAFLILAILIILLYPGFIDMFINVAKDIECNPETLGRRYGGLDHARATIGCWLH